MSHEGRKLADHVLSLQGKSRRMVFHIKEILQLISFKPVHTPIAYPKDLSEHIR